MWWLMLVIPATWEVDVEGPWSKAGLCKRTKLHMKNKLKTKGLA
jgi:hypothetical protein